MKKLMNKKGFTMAELLIVVAIIAVLVAISIPILTGRLKSSRLATNQANARSAYSTLTSELLVQSKTSGSATYTVSTAKIGTVGDAAAQSITKAVDKWTVDDVASGTKKLGDAVATSWTVSIAEDGTVTYSCTLPE